jgi:hypothetical protein
MVLPRLEAQQPGKPKPPGNPPPWPDPDKPRPIDEPPEPIPPPPPDQPPPPMEAADRLPHQSRLDAAMVSPGY